jgi:hypothetical protein
MEHSLRREDGSVVYNCRWSSPAQSFLGASSVGLVTIFYYLRFETTHFVASYVSQGHGGGIRPLLHTGCLRSYLNGCLYNLAVSMENFCWLCFPRKCSLLTLSNNLVSKSLQISFAPSMDKFVAFATAVWFPRAYNFHLCIHGHVYLIPSDGLCLKIVSPRKHVCQFVS